MESASRKKRYDTNDLAKHLVASEEQKQILEKYNCKSCKFISLELFFCNNKQCIDCENSYYCFEHKGLSKCPRCESNLVEITKLDKLKLSSLEFQCRNDCGSLLFFQDIPKHEDKFCREKQKCPLPECDKYLTESEKLSHLVICNQIT